MAKSCKCCNSGAFDNSTVKTLDMDRYLGRWYEIARIDHSFERGLTNGTADYSLNEDGSIAVKNSGFNLRKKKESVALGKAKTTGQIGRLRVSFFWIFYSDYRVLALADDYSWSLVGGKTPDFLWILTRTETIDQEIYKQIIVEAQRRGYHTENLIPGR